MPMAARHRESFIDTNGRRRACRYGPDGAHGVGKTSGLPDQAIWITTIRTRARTLDFLQPPIGQPSEKAIEAVPNPAEGTWLYS